LNGSGGFAGELRLFAGQHVPDGWLHCHGEKVDTDRFPNLADALGDSFGREGGVPLLPDLRSRALLGAGPDRGGSRPNPNPDPGRRVGERGPALCDRDSGEAAASLGLTYIINPHDAPAPQMIGEVRPFPYSYVPAGWMKCDGTQLQIADYSTLFVVVGDAFGGNGRRTFKLPDLRGFTPLSHGRGLRLNPTTRRGSRRRGLAKGADFTGPRLHMIHAIARTGDFPGRAGR
jgi:microcystin-dependent protein